MSDVLSNSSRRSLNFKPPHTLRSQKWDTSDQWILTRTKPLHLPPTTTTQEYQTHGESAYEGFLPTIMHAVSTAYMRQAISKQILNIEVTPLLMLLLFFLWSVLFLTIIKMRQTFQIFVLLGFVANFFASSSSHFAPYASVLNHTSYMRDRYDTLSLEEEQVVRSSPIALQKIQASLF